MKDREKTKKQLLNELVELRHQIAELEISNAQRNKTEDLLRPAGAEGKQAAEALQKADERYRKQYEEAIDAIFLADLRTGMIVDCNIAASKRVERENSEIIGKHQSFLHPAEDIKDGLSKTFKSHVTGESSELLEDRVITKSGQIKDVAIRASKITIEGKKVMQGIFRDITKRKRVEEELKRLSHQNALILNAAGEGIFGLDIQGKHTFVNPAAAQMLGYTVNELIGRHSHTLWHYKKSDGSSYPVEECPIYAAYKDGRVHHRDDEVFWRKDGTCFPVTYTSTPIIEDGNIAGAVVTFRDITERKQAEEELKTLSDELARSNADLQQFAYTESHDLQEPIMVVAGFVNLLARRYKGKLDEKADEFIEHAIDGTKRMQVLIKDLLDYSRVGSTGTSFTPTDCLSALDKAVFNLQIALKESGAVITHDDLPTVMADSSQVIRLFQNLISNAIKFHGKEAPRIHISAT